MKTESSYSDSLVKISDDGILFRSYGFFGGDRFVPIDDIEKIEVKKSTIWNGKWRWHGSGDFKTWFPADYARNKRDAIFIVYIYNKWWRIGFTVEDSKQVAGILQDKGLINGISGISSVITSETDNNAIINRNKNKQGKAVFWIILILSSIALPLILILYFVFFD